MTKQFSSHFRWHSKRSFIASALAALALTVPAVAKPMTECQVRHSKCSERCIMGSSGSDAAARSQACIDRTCTHQYKACAKLSGESENPYHDQKGMTPPLKKDSKAGSRI